MSESMREDYSHLRVHDKVEETRESRRYQKSSFVFGDIDDREWDRIFGRKKKK